MNWVTNGPQEGPFVAASGLHARNSLPGSLAQAAATAFGQEMLSRGSVGRIVGWLGGLPKGGAAAAFLGSGAAAAWASSCQRGIPSCGDDLGGVPSGVKALSERTITTSTGSSTPSPQATPPALLTPPVLSHELLNREESD